VSWSCVTVAERALSSIQAVQSCQRQGQADAGELEKAVCPG